MRTACILLAFLLCGCATRRMVTAPSVARSQAIAAEQQQEVRNAARELRNAAGSNEQLRTLADIIDYKASHLFLQP